MGFLKTISLSLVAMVIVTPSARADAGLVAETATCAGRLSAEVQHKWLMQAEDAIDTQRALEAMLLRLEALTGAQDTAALSLRIKAKHAHAMLLQRASFSHDVAQANRAASHARHLITQCERLVQGYLQATSS